MCDKLIIGLSTDECIKYKFKNTIIKYNERKNIGSYKIGTIYSQTDTDKYDVGKK